MRIAVAATASFGADVLERLAALPQLEVAFLLTRPDAPRGRGRRLAPPPAKEAAERLGIPVIQPGTARAAARRGRRRRRLRVRPPDPGRPARTVAVAQRPPLPAPALARRGPGRTGDPRGRRGDRRHDPRDGQGPRRRPDRGAGGLPDRPRRRRRQPSSSDPQRLAASLLAGVLPAPRFTPQPDEGATYAEKITPADRELDLADPLDAWRRVRALSPHIGAWAVHPRTPGDDLARRARKRDTRPARGATGGAAADELRGVPARRASVTAPARAAAFRVVRRVFEDGAYADRAMASAADGLDTRDRALAQRIAYGTVQRMRTIDHGIDVLGSRPAAELDPPVLAALRIAGYEAAWSETPAHATVNDVVELVRDAGLAARDRFHECGRTASRRRVPGARRGLAAGAARRVLSRLDLPDLGQRFRRGRGARPDAGAERARRARRPLGGAGRRADRRSRAPTGSSAGNLEDDDEDPCLAEPRIAARRARRRLPRRRADPRRVCGAGREGDDAPRAT